MKNKIECGNCNSESDFFEMNCQNCGALLRDKFPNIDLFSTIWLLIESPSKAIKKIIFSEHKNYLTLLFILLTTKFVFTSFFLQSVFIEPVNYQRYLSINFGIGFAVIGFLVLLFPLLQRTMLQNSNVKTRYKDNLAVLVFSQIPTILFLLLILPFEFALFGKFWLFSNPSPFMIKETAAYAFSIMEIIVLIWSVLLFGLGTYIQSKNKSFSVVNTILFILIFVGAFFLIPYLA
jgi:hypothetical protein